MGVPIDNAQCMERLENVMNVRILRLGVTELVCLNKNINIANVDGFVLPQGKMLRAGFFCDGDITVVL